MEADDREGLLTVSAGVLSSQARDESWIANGAASAARPGTLLSVCIPVFRFDVVQLAEGLLRQAALCREAVELLLVDDASGEEGVLERLTQCMVGTTIPVKLLVLRSNQGRARVRNHLTAAATGRYLLFLDCDMYPDSDQFLSRYVDCARTGESDIVVGGCSYARLRRVPASNALYYYHSNRTQCVSARRRSRNPLRYVFTNNMLIKSSLLSQLTFDSEYKGWGYEDTDLAVGASRAGAVITHVENTATHLGLIDDDAVIAKYRNSTQNFVRLVRKFPQEARSFPMYRVARRLAWVPLPFSRLAVGLEPLVRARSLPVRIRYALLQCMRLVMCSGALRRDFKRKPPLTPTVR